MRKLFITLLAVIALPTAVNAESNSQKLIEMIINFCFNNNVYETATKKLMMAAEQGNRSKVFALRKDEHNTLKECIKDKASDHLEPKNK